MKPSSLIQFCVKMFIFVPSMSFHDTFESENLKYAPSIKNTKGD